MPSSSPSSVAEALAHDALVVGEQDAGSRGSHSSTRNPSAVGSAESAPAEQLGALAHAGQPVAAAASAGRSAARATGAPGPWSWTTSVVPSSA